MFFQKEGLASISERSNEGSDASCVGRQAAVARGVNDIRVEAVPGAVPVRFVTAVFGFGIPQI